MIVSTFDILIAADFLEEHGFPACETLRQIVAEPRKLEAWEAPADPTLTPGENRLRFWCRVFHDEVSNAVVQLMKEESRQGVDVHGVDVFDRAVWNVINGNTGILYAEAMI